MNYICIHTKDQDLAESFKIFFEGKYHIQFISERNELEDYIRNPECKCQVMIYDAVNPTGEDVKFLNEFKSAFPEIKILICYVYFEERRFSEDLLASTVDDIVYKPFDFGEVDRRLQQLLMPPASGNDSSAPHRHSYEYDH